MKEKDVLLKNILTSISIEFPQLETRFSLLFPENKRFFS